MRTMLSLPPYNNWPLHVKLFHTDAVNEWASAAASVPSEHLPPGLTVSVELEGVDGKSTRPAIPGSNIKRLEPIRDTPIDVKDST